LPIADIKGGAMQASRRTPSFSTPLKAAFGIRQSAIILALLLLGITPLRAQDSSLVALVRDYTGLYSKATFDQWTRIFGPGFTSASANATGGVTVRNLNQFLEAQRQGFANAKEMREELSNVRIEQRDRLASIWADFVFHYDGAPSKGKLVLLAVSDSLGWKFHSLMFAYDK
jgi:hypothetical protein